jgi:hypothetical protein
MSDTPPSGPECYRRACDLLEQAFEVRPSASDPMTLVSKLPEAERDRYIAAAQAYATLAAAAGVTAPRWISPVRDNGGHDIFTGE